jgi:hypothetical protein
VNGYGQCGGGASDNDNVEEDGDRPRGGGLSLIDDKDGQVGRAIGVEDNGMGRATASASTFASTITQSGQGGDGVLVVAFKLNTYQSGPTCFMSHTYHFFSTIVL